MAAEIIKGKMYSCLDLKSSKGKEEDKSNNKTEYSFDFSKEDQIFNYLLKDKQIRLVDSHKIPPPEELKGKKYWKWHSSYNHAWHIHLHHVQKGHSKDY